MKTKPHYKNTFMKNTVVIGALFTLLLSLHNIGFCQKTSPDNFILNGKINSNFGTVNIHPLSDISFYPKSFLKIEGIIKNGKFTLSGKIQSPQCIYLEYKDSTGQGRLSDLIYIDKGIQNVSYKVETKGISGIENKTTNEYQNLYKPLSKLNSERYKALNTYYDSIRRIGNDSLLKIANVYFDSVASTIYQKSRSINLEYVSAHPNTYLVLWNVIGQIPWGYEPIYDSIYSKFSNEIKTTYAGLALKRWLDNGRITKIGNPFPFIQLYSIEGKASRLNFSGIATYTLLDVWYSHCGPCRAQFPKLKKTYSTFHNKGFEIVGISIDKKADLNDYANAIKNNGLTWMQYCDINGVVCKKLGVDIYPSNFLLDKSGKIIAKNISPDELEVFLNKNLNQK